MVTCNCGPLSYNNNNGFYKVSYPGGTISKTLYIYKKQEYKKVTKIVKINPWGMSD